MDTLAMDRLQVLRYARRLAGAREAEDLVQEAARRCLLATGRIDRRMWYRAVYSVWVDEMRRRRRITFVPLGDDDRPDSLDVADLVARADERERVWATLAALTPAYREVLISHYVREEPLGNPTRKSAALRARQRFRERWLAAA